MHFNVNDDEDCEDSKFVSKKKEAKIEQVTNKITIQIPNGHSPTNSNTSLFTHH